MADSVEGRRKRSGFGDWYAKVATKLGLDPDPDSPLHFYNYRDAYRAGADPDESGHFPSEFKKRGHPNRFVEGIDTKTGKAASEGAMRRNQKRYARVMKKING